MSDNQTNRNRLTGGRSDGILLLLLGAVLLLWPETALHIAVMIIGGALALFGVLACVRYFRGTGETRGLVVGLIMAGLGIAMLCASHFFAGILYIAVGTLVALGVVRMALEVLHKDGDRKRTGFAIVFGVALLVLAVLIFVRPAGLTKFFLRLQGIALIVEGLSMLLVKPRQ